MVGRSERWAGRRKKVGEIEEGFGVLAEGSMVKDFSGDIQRQDGEGPCVCDFKRNNNNCSLIQGCEYKAASTRMQPRRTGHGSQHHLLVEDGKDVLNSHQLESRETNGSLRQTGRTTASKFIALANMADHLAEQPLMRREGEEEEEDVDLSDVDLLLEKNLRNPGLFVWLLTFSAGISGLLFGCKLKNLVQNKLISTGLIGGFVNR